MNDEKGKTVNKLNGEVEEDLRKKGKRTFACRAKRSEGMNEDFTGSQDPLRTRLRKKVKIKKQECVCVYIYIIGV